MIPPDRLVNHIAAKHSRTNIGSRTTMCSNLWIENMYERNTYQSKSGICENYKLPMADDAEATVFEYAHNHVKLYQPTALCLGEDD